jgi:hypothetical protein
MPEKWSLPEVEQLEGISIYLVENLEISWMLLATSKISKNFNTLKY